MKLTNAGYVLPLIAVLSAVPGLAQHFDPSGNGNLKGAYFVREILIAGQGANGQITKASSAIGVATFDGKGGYTFAGQGMNSATGPQSNLTTTGTYLLASNGLLTIGSLLDAKDRAFGAVAAIGASAFVASATEGSNVDIIIGVPAGATATNATLRGSYSAGYIDFLNANAGQIRQASFGGTADGAGSLGNLAVGGYAVDNGGAPVSQTVPGVAYNLSGQGTGTVNFGPAATSQLISGTKNLYISADQKIFFAGSPGGYDLLVGIQSLPALANNAVFSGEYFIAGLENFAGSPGQSGSGIDGFYGSVNATGTGSAIFHNRFQSFASPVFDYTFSSQATVSSTGVYAPSDIPYRVTIGDNGQAFVATGAAGLYSLTVGLGAPKFSGSGVYLNPLGVVNAGNFAPITNPIAPGELVALFGTGLAGSAAQAPSLPLPKTLGGVQVTVNGAAVPLFYVSPTQITFQAPSTIGPASGVFYATIQVTNNNVASNSVTVYTNDSAPGVITAGGNAIGPAAAQHASYALIDPSNPARAGETVLLYLVGGGPVAPPVADGAAASSSPLSTVVKPASIDFSGELGATVFEGLTPSLAGLYQLNATIPETVGSGDVYVNVSTPDATTSEATLHVSGFGNAAKARAAVRNLHPATSRTRGLTARTE